MAATLWQPRSGCGAACLPAGAVLPAASRTMVAARLLALLTVLLAGAALAPALVLLTGRIRLAMAGGFARLLLRTVGVRLSVRGRLPRRHALVVANHVSWLDAVALVAAAPVRMLAKREVRGWPLIGALATAAGTLFVDRRRPRTLPGTVAEVAEALRGGRVVAAFPEGTTFCGTDGGGFRPALFQAAIDAGAPVVPATITYRLGRGCAPTTVAAFLGEDTLWRSICRVTSVRGLAVSVVAAPALHPGPAATRRGLARVAEATIHGGREPAVPAPVRTLTAGGRRRVTDLGLAS